LVAASAVSDLSQPVDYFVDATSIRQTLKAELKGARIAYMVIYKDYVTCEAEDTQDRGHFNHYELRRSVLSKQDPVVSPSENPGLDLDAIAFEEIPRLTREAPTLVGFEHGRATVDHVAIAYPRKQPEAQIEVFVQRAGQSRAAVYNLGGTLLRADTE
jgi:hypothetical protein